MSDTPHHMSQKKESGEPSVGENSSQNKTFVLAGDFTGGGFHNVLMIQQSGETVCCWLIDKEGNASLESAFNHPPGWEPFRVCDVNQDGKQELLWKHEDGSMISTIVIERKTDDCQIRIDIKKFFGGAAEPDFKLDPVHDSHGGLNAPAGSAHSAES